MNLDKHTYVIQTPVKMHIIIIPVSFLMLLPGQSLPSDEKKYSSVFHHRLVVPVPELHMNGNGIVK